MIWGATWWEAASAIGTVGAVVVALLLAAGLLLLPVASDAQSFNGYLRCSMS